jgi:hypothetical protein
LPITSNVLKHDNLMPKKNWKFQRKYAKKNS